MAVFGSLLFNRTLKQFLACKDLSSKSGLALTEKIKSQSATMLEKILETIPETKKPHSDVLKKICQDEINRESEDRFLDNLENDTTMVRLATKNLLSESVQINPSKLFKRLHETDSDTSKTEIIDILEMQKTNLAPEMYVKNAIRMDKGYAGRLIEMAQSQAHRTDMSALSIDIDTLENPDIKIKLIRFLAAVNQDESAQMIMGFLNDKSKIIVIEALKQLKHMEVEFDPSPIVQKIPEMREDDMETAFEILQKKSSAQSLPGLALLMTSKSESFRERATQIVLDHVTTESLEALLIALDDYEWWGKEQAVNSLLNQGNDRLFKMAGELLESDNEFVSNTAEQLSANNTVYTGDIEGLTESLMHENWQVRERAIENAGNSGNREALELLNKVIKKYPESSIAALKAVKKLGFSKGLELTSKCLGMKEAAIQREALLTTDSIVTQKHADSVRNGIIKIVPRLQATVRDTAQEVIQHITDKYKLPKLNLDDDILFETRLLEIEKNKQDQSTSVMPPPQSKPVELDKTEVVSFQQIEELKMGDYWMDRFKVVKEVGRGAMGRVMLVHDDTVGESLILKFMHPELTADGKARERFLRELKYSRMVTHPNVIRIHDFLMKDGISAISMEYFESHGLDYMIKHELLATHEQILDILYQVSEGMYEAHQKNVIHRDLKPSNIMVNDDGLAKVVDFGIASASTVADVTLTKTGMIIGTPAYLSPERARGLEADHRADIYALGIIAYNMLNGGLPYKGEPMSLLFQHIEGKAIPLDTLDKGISSDVSMLVQKMMAVDLDERFQTMKEVGDAIKELM
jgi:serine/threonine-protein kinase